MVMVGALNVMRIDISEKSHLVHGEELGMFNLGSTIIMIIEAKDLKEWKVQPGQKIKVGEPLLEYLPAWCFFCGIDISFWILTRYGWGRSLYRYV